MSYIRDNTVSGTKTADIYADLATLLTANGWTQVGTTLTIGSQYWNIWKNPAANSGLSKDFHVAIGYGTAGDGPMRFRPFEDWIGGAGHEIQRWLPRQIESGDLVNNGGYYEDAYGKSLTGYSSTAYPIPWTPGVGNFARGSGDYSVGAYDSNQSVSGTQEEAILNSAPHAVHLLSAYVSEYAIQCNDDTAAEYVISVDEYRIAFAVKRVFGNQITGMVAGAYEPLHVNDPFPLCATFLQSSNPYYDQHIAAGGDNLANYSRYWGHDGPPEASNNSGWNVEAGLYYTGYTLREHTHTTGIIQPDWTAVSTSTFDNGEFDSLAGGAVVSRLALAGPFIGNSRISSYANRALLYDVLIGYQINTAGSPAITFGDEVTINGQTWIFVGCLDSYELDDAVTGGNVSDNDPIFFPKF